MTMTDATETTPAPETPDLLCGACGEDDVTPEAPVHGECLLLDAFGGIAEIMVPEDVDEIGPHAGLTPRQSGLAVELLLAKASADMVAKGGIVETMCLKDRRLSLGLLRGYVLKDVDEIAKYDPKLAAEMRVKSAVSDYLDAMGIGSDDDENAAAEDKAEDE